MFCPKCGKEAPNGSTFCPSCGAKLADDGTGTETHPKKKKRRLWPALVVLAVLVVLGGGTAWAVSSGLIGGAADPSDTPAGSAEPASPTEGEGDGAEDASEDEATAAEGTEDGTLTDGIITLSDIEVTEVDPSTIPSAFFADAKFPGVGATMIPHSSRGSFVCGESLWMITAHAANETDDSVKGWLQFDCTITYQDDYGDKQTETETFNTSNTSSTSKFLEGGAFYLAPGEERDVMIFAAWRSNDDGLGDDWNDNSGSSDEQIPISNIDSQVGSSRYHPVVISDAEPSAVLSAGFEGKNHVATFDEFDLEVEKQAHHYSAQYGSDRLGTSVSLTNETGSRVEEVRVVTRYYYDGQPTPYLGVTEATMLTEGKEVSIVASDENLDYGPSYDDASKVTVEPAYIVYTTE